MSHKCFDRADEALKPFNSKIDFAFSLGNEPVKPVIRTGKIDQKARGKAKLLVATYCPFCGDKL